MLFTRRRTTAASCFAALLIGPILFFWWASAATLPPEAWQSVHRYPVPAADAIPDTLSVMTYNIGYLSGMTNNLPVARTPKLYADNMIWAQRLISRARPDFAAFQEIDFGGARSYDINQLDTLAQQGGYAMSARVVNWDKRYVPFPSANPMRHFGQVLSGQAVLTRHHVSTQERVILERPPNPFYYDAFYLDRLAQVVVVDAGQPLVLINVHLEAFDEATRERQIEAVRALYRRYRAEYPVLLLGDFNTPVPAARNTLQADLRRRFAEDETLDRLMAEADLAEAFPDTLYGGPNEAATYTYPADHPSAKIDHIFYNPSRIEPVAAFVLDGEEQPSDHRAVVMRFVLRKEGF